MAEQNKNNPDQLPGGPYTDGKTDYVRLLKSHLDAPFMKRPDFLKDLGLSEDQEHQLSDFIEKKLEDEHISDNEYEEIVIKIKQLKNGIIEESQNQIGELKTELEPKNNEKLSKRERMRYIENIIKNKDSLLFLESVIEKLEGKTIYLDDFKKVILDKDYINKNKEEILNNLKNLILLIIEIESDGNPEAESSVSSASGLGQWLIGNGQESIEYLYNKNWESGKIKGIKPKKERTVRLTNSFETTLRNINKKFDDSVLKKFHFIPNNFNQKTNINPLDLSLKEQVQLLILDLGSNTKKIKNGNGQEVGIQDFLGTAILGNPWAMKQIYKIFHHTKPDKNTIERIKNITPKYTKKLIALN